jgi:hypothetical protein
LGVALDQRRGCTKNHQPRTSFGSRKVRLRLVDFTVPLELRSSISSQRERTYLI